MSEKTRGKLTDWAQLRFSIIGGLLASPPKRGDLQKELKCLAGRCYPHPTEDKLVRFGASTIERWYYQALGSEDPIQALGRKVRSDAGHQTAISPRLLTLLKKQYEDYPKWSYQLHSDNLAALVSKEPEPEKAPSYSTVKRCMKKRGWYKKKGAHRPQSPGQKQAQQRLDHREVRSFESEYVSQLWHLDFHEGRRVVDVNGHWYTPKALCILDDRSRLCCHIQWYLNETTETLIHGLSQAFHKRGLPRSLMTDNGSGLSLHMRPKTAFCIWESCMRRPCPTAHIKTGSRRPLVTTGRAAACRALKGGAPYFGVFKPGIPGMGGDGI